MGRILSINDERVVCLRSPLPRGRIPQTRWPPTLPQRSHGLSHIITILVMAPAVPCPSYWVAFATSLSLKSFLGTSILAGMFAANIFDLVT